MSDFDKDAVMAVVLIELPVFADDTRCTTSDIVRKVGLDPDIVREALDALFRAGVAMTDSDGYWWFTRHGYKSLMD